MYHISGIALPQTTQAPSYPLPSVEIDPQKVRRMCFEKLNAGAIYEGMWTDGERCNESIATMKHLRKSQANRARITAFIGTTGTGKTCASIVGAIDAMFQHAVDEFHKAVRETGVGRRVIDGMFATTGIISRSSGFQNTHALQVLMSTHVLVMDDLRKKDEGQVTTAFIGLIDELIDERYRHGLTTFINSNLSVKDFKATYGDRVFSRLSESGYLAPCVGDDLRMKGTP